MTENGFFSVELPIVQAPMAGVSDSALAIAVAKAGGLGSLPCFLLDAERMRSEVGLFRSATSAPLNLNFFCHEPPQRDDSRERAWAEQLSQHEATFGLPPAAKSGGAPPIPGPFDRAMCDLVTELRPEVVSFHFGLPDASLVDQLHAADILVMCSATTVNEARWLESAGCDVIIAQGVEAGGHRGMFLETDVRNQLGTMALVPQVVDAVKVPVVAAGGISDARAVEAARALGAAAVQVGTAFMLSPEALTSPVHRAALQSTAAERTVLTNVFSGKPARSVVNRMIEELGPISADVPAFPLPSFVMARLRGAAEAAGSSDYSPLWAGQGAPLARAEPAGDIVRRLVGG